tara:strand:+ start:164 stop:352 length:189 start_codon:yes stop_codon:yes gene_type:complete
VEIKLVKDTEVLGIKRKKGDVIDLPPDSAEKYLNAKLAEPNNETVEAVIAKPKTGSINAKSE